MPSIFVVCNLQTKSMIPNFQYLKDKFTQTYSWLANNYYGPQQTIDDISKLSPQDKIFLLRKLLKSQCIYSESVQGKIQMQYFKILQSLTYKKFHFTTQIPFEHPIPQKMPQKKLICIFGEYNLKTEKIKCPLMIQILFEESFPESFPRFYVKTPKFPEDKDSLVKLLRTAKPNRLVVDITANNGNKFKARTDGIQVIFAQRNSEWKMDVKELLDECVDMLRSQFPFVKMKEPVMLVELDANVDGQTKLLYDKSQKIKEILSQKRNEEEKNGKYIKVGKQVEKNNFHPSQNSDTFQSSLPLFLQETQTLDILNRAIEIQNQYLKQQSQKMKQTLKQAELIEQQITKSHDYSSLYPVISSNPLHRELLQAMVSYQASHDCLHEVQKIHKIQYGGQNEHLSHGQLKKLMNIWQQVNQNIFYQRYQINQLIDKIKSQSEGKQ